MNNKTQTRKGTKMSRDYRDLQVGQRVYYTGDMANMPEWATITKRWEDRWGLHYNMTGDEGRDFFAISPANFTGPGHRFETKEEHDAKRAAKIAEMERQFAAMRK